MRWVRLGVLMCAAGVQAARGDGIGIPWEEFRKAYRESIESEVLRKAASQQPALKPALSVIESARYRLVIGTNGVQGEAELRGRFLPGEPQPVPLLDTALLVTELREIAGGTLFPLEGTPCGIGLFPAENTNFSARIAFRAPVADDPPFKRIAFVPPRALQTTLRLDCEPGMAVEQSPGIAGADGWIHLPAGATIAVRFRDTRQPAIEEPIEADSLTRIRVAESRIVLTYAVRLQPPLPGRFTVAMPADATCLGVQPRAVQIRHEGDGLLGVLPPSDLRDIIVLRFSLPADAGKAACELRLPSIRRNTGREGLFVADPPENGEVAVSGAGLSDPVAPETVDAELRKWMGGTPRFARIGAQEPLRLQLRRFPIAHTPSIVLDTLDFFTSVDETGNSLGMLVATVPAETGPRLRMRAVPDVEIWSVSVNGRKTPLYTEQEGEWIVPLDTEARESRVELAYLRKGPKLGIHGRVECALPETRLPARALRVGIALPQRLRILSLEGPVSPAPGAAWKAPQEFVGQPFYFTRSFYQGEAMKLMVSYEEPTQETRK